MEHDPRLVANDAERLASLRQQRDRFKAERDDIQSQYRRLSPQYNVAIAQLADALESLDSVIAPAKRILARLHGGDDTIQGDDVMALESAIERGEMRRAGDAPVAWRCSGCGDTSCGPLLPMRDCTGELDADELCGTWQPLVSHPCSLCGGASEWHNGMIICAARCAVGGDRA